MVGENNKKINPSIPHQPIHSQRHQKLKIKMETYVCADCGNDHHLVWSDFATMFWVHKNPYYLKRVKPATTSKSKIRKAIEKMTLYEEKYTKELKKFNEFRGKRHGPQLLSENQCQRAQNSLQKLNGAQVDLAIEFLKNAEIDNADSLMEKCRKCFEHDFN